VAVSGDESLSIMVNEEDHLRMQVLRPGLQLDAAFERMNQVDDAVEHGVSYAFSKRFGYLTACPTNIGTGLRLGVMMHLPGLRLTNELDRVRRAAKDLHLAVRGFYGEGSESAGDLYQVSNQVTLGRSEEELLEEFRGQVAPQLIEYERAARKVLMDSKPLVLDDRIHRSLGVLRTARLLSADETMKLLSRVRLGACLGRLEGVEPSAIDRLSLQIQPAHLKRMAGQDLAGDDEREARATLVRRALAC
jgi:protein arginine kinase